MMWLSLAFTVGSAGFNATMHMVTKREGASLAFFAYLLTVASFVSLVGTRLVTPLSFSALSPVFFAWTAGTMLGEMLYALGLRFAYRTLDLSVVYPMTRALPILFLAVVTTAFGFGKPISPRGALGLLMVCGGSLMVPLRSFSEWRLPGRMPQTCRSCRRSAKSASSSDSRRRCSSSRSPAPRPRSREPSQSSPAFCCLFCKAAPRLYLSVRPL